RSRSSATFQLVRWLCWWRIRLCHLRLPGGRWIGVFLGTIYDRSFERSSFRFISDTSLDSLLWLQRHRRLRWQGYLLLLCCSLCSSALSVCFILLGEGGFLSTRFFLGL